MMATLAFNELKLKIRTTDQCCVPVLGQCSISVSSETQPVFICSKLTIGTLEQGVKYVQS